MLIGTIEAKQAFEGRVAITPDAVKKYTKLGHEVIIESGSGLKAYYSDRAYIEAGAKVATETEVLTQADIVCVVQDLTGAQIAQLDKGKIVVGMLDPYRNEQLANYANQSVTAFAMELLPRTLSRAQNMDVLSSQANLAGYKAVLLAANEFARPFPMFMTSAGTVKPAKVIILGVGVAGLQAIATARRLGAVVEASDLRPSVREQVESVGGKWLDVPMSDAEKEKAKSTGGYAWRPSEEYMKDQAVVVDKAATAADIVITTAQIPGRDAPRLIHKATLDKMKAGSVIVDMAASSGGNVEGMLLGETITTDNGVRIIGAANIPASLAAQSSDLYANNLLNFIATLFDNENNTLAINLEDDIQGALAVTYNGEIRLQRS